MRDGVETAVPFVVVGGLLALIVLMIVAFVFEAYRAENYKRALDLAAANPLSPSLEFRTLHVHTFYCTEQPSPSH